MPLGTRAFFIKYLGLARFSSSLALYKIPARRAGLSLLAAFPHWPPRAQTCRSIPKLKKIREQRKERRDIKSGLACPVKSASDSPLPFLLKKIAPRPDISYYGLSPKTLPRENPRTAKPYQAPQMPQKTEP